MQSESLAAASVSVFRVHIRRSAQPLRPNRIILNIRLCKWKDRNLKQKATDAGFHKEGRNAGVKKGIF